MRLVLLIISLLQFHCLFSQGCSDAGFCTMGAMKPDQPFNKNYKAKLYSIEFSQYYGITHFNNHIWVSTMEANISLGEKYTAQVKIPYQLSSGHLGTYQSMSDISFSITRNIIRQDNFDLNITVGTKIPSNNGDLQQFQGRSLPMYYQTSLGTHDLIVGASIITKKWLLAVGYQQALDRNQNGFWWGEWRKEDAADTSYILRYAQSNNLQRGKDVMIRIERNFRFSQFNASIGLLPIYRLNADDIQVPSLTSNLLTPKVSIGSDGLALSAIYTLGYHFNTNSSIKLLVGNRIVQRPKNPDGLSREFVTSFTYQYRF
ncbi:MAG: hypothetical protein JST43_12265 [Bacteroidetes bacterium]|nr:hypothetical protein [Bacteroidota bacterium]MBS1541635.1 hypothetical protein [Bacteroidota bacterium]